MINYLYIFLFPVCYVGTIFLKDYKLKVLTKIKDKHFCKVIPVYWNNFYIFLLLFYEKYNFNSKKNELDKVRIIQHWWR